MVELSTVGTNARLRKTGATQVVPLATISSSQFDSRYFRRLATSHE